MDFRAKCLVGIIAFLAVIAFSPVTHAGVNPNGSVSQNGGKAAKNDGAAVADLMTNAPRCAHMTNPDYPSVDFYIQLWVGGKITGTICDAPNWTVTGLRVNKKQGNGELWADYTGVNTCATNYHLMITSVVPGPIGVGTYCWNNDTYCYKANLEKWPCNF